MIDTNVTRKGRCPRRHRAADDKTRTAPMPSSPMRALLDRFPGTRDELAAAAGFGRQTLWKIETAAHVKRPVRQLKKLASAFDAHGTCDKSEIPALADFVLAWDFEHGGRGG